MFGNGFDILQAVSARKNPLQNGETTAGSVQELFILPDVGVSAFDICPDPDVVDQYGGTDDNGNEV